MLAIPAWSARRGAGRASGRWAGFHGQEALALEPLARELARAADGLGFLTRFLFGGFLVMTAQLHFAEDALALHLLLKRLEGLVDVVVTDKNLHAGCLQSIGLRSGGGAQPCICARV